MGRVRKRLTGPLIKNRPDNPMTAPTKARRTKKEHSDQVRLVMRVKVFMPHVIIAAIPNGADISAAQRIKLSQEGLYSGFPDLMLFAKDKPDLFIEMKREKNGRLSDEQIKCHKALADIGKTVITCHGFDEAWKVVQKWDSGTMCKA